MNCSRFICTTVTLFALTCVFYSIQVSAEEAWSAGKESSQIDANVQRPVTVEDSLFLRLFSGSNGYDDGQLALSPNGEMLAYVLRETNLDDNLNEVVLYVLDVSLPASMALIPQGRGKEIFRTRMFPLYSPITIVAPPRSVQFKWLADNKTLLVFHQPRGEKFPVVSRIEVDTGSSSVVYRPEIDATEFAADESGNRIAVAGRERSQGGKISEGYGYLLYPPTDSTSLRGSSHWMLEYESLSGIDGNYVFKIKLLDAESGDVNVFTTSPARWYEATYNGLKDLRMSSNGRWLFFSTVDPSISVQEAWLNHPANKWRKVVIKSLIVDLDRHLDDGSNLDIKYRFAFNAPGESELFQFSDDGSAYLFLGETFGAEAGQAQSIVGRTLYAVDSKTGNASTVIGDASMLRQIIGFDKNATEVRILSTNEEIITYNYASDGTSFAWMEVDRKSIPGVREIQPVVVNGGKAIGVSQSIRTPPDIWMLDIYSRERARISNVNPEIQLQDLPTVAKFKWRGSYDEDNWGYIVYPNGYNKMRRYPSVFVMKQWEPGKFIHTAQSYYNEFPILQFAASGILVLLVNSPSVVGVDADTPELAMRLAETDAIETARERLSDMGVIDRQRVGLMSFSHSVRAMQHALVSHEFWNADPWAAAIEIDGYQPNFSQYVVSSDYFKKMLERSYGGSPFGKGSGLWDRFSPARNSAKVRTPILVVEHSKHISGSEWVTSLERQGKPVEFVWFPGGGHTLQPPRYRRSWMYWAYDWMRFWLLGAERSGVEHDSRRYARWRKLREQHLWNERMIREGI